MKKKVQTVAPKRRLLTSKEVASMLGVQPEWVYLHKELPSYRVGKKRMFIEEELLTYFKQADHSSQGKAVDHVG